MSADDTKHPNGERERPPKRLFDDVPPAFPATTELDGTEAAHELRRAVSAFFDKAEKFIHAKEEVVRRRDAALNAWHHDGRSRLGLPPISTAPITPEVDQQIKQDIAAELRAELGVEVLDWAPRLQIAATAGLGKTRVVVEELTRRPFWRWRHVHIYVPTTALAEELVGLFPDDGPRVRVMRGREAGAPDNALCAKWKVARKAAQLGLNVFKTVCKREDDGGTEHVCLYFAGCLYLEQWWDTAPGVCIFAHDYLTLPKPGNLPSPDLVVVDENPLHVLTEHTNFGIDRLDDASLEAVRAHLKDGADLRESLRARGVTRETAQATAQSLEIELDHGVLPDMREDQALTALDAIKGTERHKIAPFWRRVGAEWDLDRPFHGVEARADVLVKVNGQVECQDRVFVHWPRQIRLGNATPVLLIDANADIEINQRFFGDSLETKEIRAARRAYVTQCASSRLSKRALLGENPKKAPLETLTLQKVKRIIRGLVSGGHHVLVITNKPMRKFLTAGHADDEHRRFDQFDRSEDWEGATIAHFGNIQGCDEWKDHNTVVVVGREQPPPNAVDALARAIWADDPEALVLAGKNGYGEELRGYRLRSGEQRVVSVHIHPDPRGQRIMELVREREMEQAIDRLRLVHATKPKRVIILCNIPIDVTVDELRSLDELAGTARGQTHRVRFEQAFKRTAMLPCGARDLHRAFPDLWPSEASARDAIRRCLNGGANQIKSLFDVPPHLSVAHYRRAGQPGRSSRVIFDPDRHDDPRGALERLLIESIVDFQGGPHDDAAPVLDLDQLQYATMNATFDPLTGEWHEHKEY